MEGMNMLTRKQRSAQIAMTDEEIQMLDRLYVYDGAWTPQETYAAFGTYRTEEFEELKVIQRCDTDMGPLYLLLAAGRVEVFGTSANAQSLARQIDRAYIRLSLKQLGWRQTVAGETVENLWQYDTTKHLLEVQTTYGLALVGGSIRNGGLTRQGIDDIANRLRSMAVFKNFEVILLTPNPKRGRKKALSEAAFLTLKTFIPDNPGFTDVKRIKTLPAIPKKKDNTPYLSGESWKKDRALMALPDLTKQILQMKRKERIDHALTSLECDGTLTDGQLARYYGLEIEDLTDRPYVRTIVRPTHMDFRNEAGVTFVTANRNIARLDDNALGHRAGTAEMRHLMSVAADAKSWRAEHRDSLRFEEPDAYYYDEHGQMRAIEFDTGSYSSNVIDDKLTTFTDRGFTGIYWGVTMPRRQFNLTEKIRDRLESDILICRWWKNDHDKP